MPRPPLSVLDLAVVTAGGTTADALAATTALAQRADELGYHRFWVAEHHNMPLVASTTPPVLMAHLAARTNRIRVGSGGIMLPNHAPLVVAEHVAALEALHPGRIDLGIGRAPGTNQETALALRRSFHLLGAEDFPRDLLDVMGLLGDRRGSAGLWQHFAATPAATSTPQILLLGSSDFSARLAGRLGLPFVFAHHFDQGGTLEAVTVYREAFEPSPALDEPYLIVTASVLVADTDEAAAWEAGPAILMVYGIRHGRFGPLVTPEQAAAHPDMPAARAMPSNRVVGAPDTAVTSLDDLVAATGADELMVNNVAYGLDARMRSLELLATAWGSAAPAAPVDELVERDAR